MRCHGNFVVSNVKLTLKIRAKIKELFVINDITLIYNFITSFCFEMTHTAPQK